MGYVWPMFGKIILAAAVFVALRGAPGAMALPAEARVERLAVFKARREMEAYQGGKLLKTYKIALGFSPVGAKRFEGDGKTPEGLYHVGGKNPRSRYHKNLGVDYPNAQDKAYARKRGKSPGGDIKIHGLGKVFGPLGAAHALTDWTLGCIAVTNEEIDELYAVTPVGAEIEILP
ncbi:hypothetical protein FACS1894186_6100 [Alphaproteobacteria bacterium]|nr:hypothetical protein FACS1894186_6100 [Alphaproteobacteria bacterium]